MNNSFELKDLRSANKLPMKGKKIIAGYEINEDTVKQMLTTMGVNPTEEIMSEAIGYFSAHGMEINMNNIYDFLKLKSIMSNVSVTDLRVQK